MSTETVDAERLDRALAGVGRGDEHLPARLIELAAVAAELAEILARPSLRPAERERIARRMRRLAARRRLLRLPGALPDLGHRPAVLAGAGGAAVGIAAIVGLALLRRPHAGAARG